MTKLSIVVPVYNTEKHLNRCIDSILEQTYQDFELIIVSDCSPGNCSEIVNGYNDPRIKYIKLEKNVGTYHARYKGTKIACGEYILYIDSDDKIYPELCEKLIPLINHSPDCILYKMDALKNNQIIQQDWQNRKITTYHGQEFFRAVTNLTISVGLLVLKVYRREILLKTYQELNVTERFTVGEDIITNIVASYHCNHVVPLDYIGYNYDRSNETSSTNNNTTLDSALKYLDQIQIMMNIYKTFLERNSLNLNLMTPLKKDNFIYILSLFQTIIPQNINIFSSKLENIYGSEIIIQRLLSVYYNGIDDKWYQFGKLLYKDKIRKIFSVLCKKIIKKIKK